LAERAAQDEVNLADRGGAEWPAVVRSAAVVALVGGLGAVFGEGSSVAMVATATEFGVVGIEDVGIDRADLDLADQRVDVVPDVSAVGAKSCLVQLGQLQVPLDQLAEARVGPGLSPFVDLGLKPTDGSLGLVGGLWRVRGGWSRGGSDGVS
jgi:hypothetical protein